MKSIGGIMVVIGIASFAFPRLIGRELMILQPFGEYKMIAGGVIGVVGLLLLLIGFVRGKKAEKKP